MTQLCRVQICIMVTSAMSLTPSAVLEILMAEHVRLKLKELALASVAKVKLTNPYGMIGEA